MTPALCTLFDLSYPQTQIVFGGKNYDDVVAVIDHLRTKSLKAKRVKQLRITCAAIVVA